MIQEKVINNLHLLGSESIVFDKLESILYVKSGLDSFDCKSSNVLIMMHNIICISI